MFRFIYWLGLQIYALAARGLAWTGHQKASKWMDGQRTWADRIQPLKNESVIWMHCASLGEFEQGRPVLEKLRERMPEHHFLVTFFSPSGYEQVSFAEINMTTAYLPIDTRSNARSFIDTIQPRFVLFVKYEFWYNTLDYIHEEKIPSYLISAVLRKKHFYWPLYKQYLLHCLNTFDHVFAQDTDTLQLLEERNIEGSLSGDTRIDRVLSLPNEAKDCDFSSLKTWIGERDVLVCGSTWPEDERVIFSWMEQNIQDLPVLILAPHDISENHIAWIQHHSPFATEKYSDIQSSTKLEPDQLIIIDSIGLLSRLYVLADVAYIGGAFKTGLHNILEPAAFQIPIVFGPKYHAFPEAGALLETNAAAAVRDERELQNTIREYRKPEVQKRVSRAISAYLQEHSGATEHIIRYLEQEELIP